MSKNWTKKKVAGLVVTAVIIIAVLIYSLVEAVSSPEDLLLDSFYIRPGEQISKCQSYKLYLDFESTDINVYESYATPALSKTKEREFTYASTGDVPDNGYAWFRYSFTSGSQVSVTATTESTAGNLVVVRGSDQFARYEKDFNSYYKGGYIYILKESFEGELNTTFTTTKTDDYYIIFESFTTAKKYGYYLDMTVNGTRRLYETSKLKKACSEHEHYGNCIVNEGVKENFCAIIDYNTYDTLDSENVVVKIYSTFKKRGKDEYVEPPATSSSSSSIAKPPVLSSSSSSTVVVEPSSSSTHKMSAEQSSSAWGYTIVIGKISTVAIVCIVFGAVISLAIIVFSIIFVTFRIRSRRSQNLGNTFQQLYGNDDYSKGKAGGNAPKERNDVSMKEYDFKPEEPETTYNYSAYTPPGATPGYAGAQDTYTPPDPYPLSGMDYAGDPLSGSNYGGIDCNVYPSAPPPPDSF